MSHKCCSPTTGNTKDFRVFNKQSTKPKKNPGFLNTINADSKYFCRCGNTEAQHKMKRLKTRKDRNHTRGFGKEISKAKSHHHQSSIHAAFGNMCCHTKCQCPSRMNANFPGVIPAVHEPSVITDSRLIGHHGLFNHQVKSFDIERFLSEQKKLEKSGGNENKQTSVTPHPSSPDQRFFSEGKVAVETEPSVMKTAGQTTNTHGNCQQKQNKSLPFRNKGTDITPRQRQEQQPDLTTETFKSNFFSKPGIPSPVTTTSPNFKGVVSENRKDLQLTPVTERHSFKTQSLKSKKCMIPNPEQTLVNLDSPVLQTKPSDPSPPNLPSCPTAGSCNTRSRKEDPDRVSASVRSVAARLCDGLHIPHIIRKNLASETKVALLKSLQKTHGPFLNEILLNFDPDATQPAQNQDQDPAMEDHISPADMSFRKTESRQCRWKFSPKLQQSLKRAADWRMSSTDTSSSRRDDVVGPSVSSPFVLDFEPSTTSTSDIFSPFPAVRRKKKASHSSHWKDCFDIPKRKEPFQLDLFESNFMNQTEEQSFDIEPYFHRQAKPHHEYLFEPTQFPQEEDPFQFNQRSFAPSFAAQRDLPPPFPPPLPRRQLSHPSSFNQHTHTLVHTPFRPHDTDMMHFPPSHQLERAETQVSSFSSPVHWSFPRMRLY